MMTVAPAAARRTALRVACRAPAALLVGILGANPLWSAPPLQWSECRLEHPLRLNSVQAQCSRLSVPENRDDPASPRIELKVARVAALNRRKLASPLFLLAGGPGQSAIAMYVSYAPAFARINRNHDIVLLDQRGTGASSPMQCEFPQDWSDETNTPYRSNRSYARPSPSRHERSLTGPLSTIAAWENSSGWIVEKVRPISKRRMLFAPARMFLASASSKPCIRFGRRTT